eukprot:6510791-Alexandrium_andersonii.AAC.1
MRTPSSSWLPSSTLCEAYMVGSHFFLNLIRRRRRGRRAFRASSSQCARPTRNALRPSSGAASSVVEAD